jgi:hypothetical protein
MPDDQPAVSSYPYKMRNRRGDTARGPFVAPPDGFIKQMYERALQATAAPFVGLTTDGTVIPNLFRHKPGPSLKPVTDAANAFIAALEPGQRRAMMFDLDAERWRTWSNIHIYMFRDGVCLADLRQSQRDKALELIRASMSAAGYTLARDIMKLNEHVRELTGKDEAYGEWYYWVSIFGTPSTDKPWGWQIDGHHLILNCFIIGDAIVLTPQFMGSEPVDALSGKYKGTSILKAEEAQGLGLMKAFSDEQRKTATIGDKLPFDVFATAYRDNMTMKYEGLRYDEFDKGQQELLARLIKTYVDRLPPGHAEIRLDEVLGALKDTHFAWIGPCNERDAFYYRIHSPQILIEFDHQAGIVFENDHHTRDHIHTLVRTPNGGDYGKDLLMQHYLQHDHANPHSPHRMGTR